MRRTPSPYVLFVAAAGPELGFGHLVRAGILADALGARRQIVLRGPVAAVEAAIRFGWTVHVGPDLLDVLSPDLVVIDDPSSAETRHWVRRARRAQIPVATIHDGRSTSADADLVIDGSLMVPHQDRSDRLAGPAFALLDERIAIARSADVVRERARVLIALGGGVHVRRLGVDVAKALIGRVPGLRVDLAAGFTATDAWPALPRGCRWLSAPDGLVSYLSHATVVVVAGGLTLYEACALGCAAVAVPVVPGQRPAIRVAARVGAVMNPTGRSGRVSVARVASAVVNLLANPAEARHYQQRARRLVDGRGAMRVAERLRALSGCADPGGWRHAA